MDFFPWKMLFMGVGSRILHAKDLQGLLETQPSRALEGREGNQELQTRALPKSESCTSVAQQPSTV